MASNREIKALSDFEHVRTRPTMYVGQIAKTETKVPIVKVENGEYKIVKTEIIISPAFYKLYDEVLGNAFDEAIRMNGKMKQISIHFDSKTNRVTVTDTGGGFFKGTDINDKTGRTNIETAFTVLKAGSNFDDTREDEVIGTNGVGVSLVNMLAEEFEVTTVNSEYTYNQKWTAEDWKENRLTEYTKSKKNKATGTTVSFVPDKSLFTDQWNKEYIHSLMIFKNFVRQHDPLLKKMKFKAFFDNEELNLNIPILPKDSFAVESPIGKVWVYPAYKDSMDISFVNGQLCEGSHQRIIYEYLDEKVFDFPYAHWYFNTVVLLSLKPKLVQFADQNKTKFATARQDLLPHIQSNFFGKLKNLKSNKTIFNAVKKKIDEYERINAVRELKKARKKASDNNAKFLSKYYPPSGNKDFVFLAEGASASGGLIESRDTKTVGVYALKGKIKNTKSVSDLSQSQEIAQLMNILGLELDKKVCDYKNIVIAVDSDPDGIGHISPLLVNFFHKWFPWLIEQGRIFILLTPVITARVNGRLSHYYSKDSFYRNPKRTTEKTYIKGLGALSEEDWKLIFKNMRLLQVTADRSATKMLEIAFGKDASLRKQWLENKI